VHSSPLVLITTSHRSSRKAEIAKMESEIRKLQKRRDGDDSDDSEAAAQRAKKAKRSYLSEELAKYSKGRGLHKKGKKRDEGDVLAALNSFRGKLQSSMFMDEESAREDIVPANEIGDDNPEPGAGEEGAGMEVDDDTGFMGHALHFAKDDAEETKAERDYEVIDPRVRSAKAKEEERERKKAALKAKGVSGGRFRRQ
jgi:peptidyl-prolyl cis-trans isomerase SDCCAG10